MPLPLSQSIESNVATSGRGHMVVADRSGWVYIIDKGLQGEGFLAYNSGRVTHMKQLKQRNILVTVGVSIAFTSAIHFPVNTERTQEKQY